jgi:phage terminase Nu1 subunit (DNA packaging protein)
LKRKAQAAELKGWKQIAEYLAQPVPTVQRWAKSGMPVRREGRFMVASQEELSRWLGRESGAKQPVRIATDNADLAGDLRRALADARQRRRK